MSAIGSLMLIWDSYSSRILSDVEDEMWIRSRVSGRWPLAVASDERPAASDQLPARLSHTRDHPGQRQLAEANAAETKATQKRARAAATAAAVVLAHFELR